MSQLHKCKTSPQTDHVVPNGDNAPRHSRSMVRTAKDLQSRSTHPNESQRNKSKKKIPKSLRYDLESALVGLCDVWFEKIKPHLVRNNIKLHVHNKEEADDAACACGDFEQPKALHCTHLDPGAAPDLPRQKDVFYVDSCATQPTASEVRCFKQQVLTLHQNQTPHKRPRMFHQNNEIPVLLKNKRKPQTRRISRLCQTSGIIPVPMTEPTLSNKDTHTRDLFKSIFNKVPICPPTSPQNPLPKSKRIVSVASQTVPPKAQMPYSLADKLYTFSRPWAYNSPIRQEIPQEPCRNPPILFPNDLIDIIGKRNDKICQEKTGYPSLLNLVSPRDRQKTTGPKKNPPWR